MGVFLQTALFPGCDEIVVRTTMESVAKSPDFDIDLEKCRYIQSPKGAQVLMEGALLGFDFLAKVLFDMAVSPVMLLHIYDDDYWGYDFYSKNEEDHFNTFPDCFGPVTQDEKKKLSGNPAMLAKCFAIRDVSAIDRYFIHWSDWDEDELEEAGVAYPDDHYPYGDCWQMTDFIAKLGFPWPFDEEKSVSLLQPPLPVQGEILEQNLPPLPRDGLETCTLLSKLPTAFSPEYIRHLLEEDSIQRYEFESQTPDEIIEAVYTYRRSVKRPECDPLCQRLAVLAAFCAHWLSRDSAWGLLDYATYEPLSVSYEKPTDIYILRARAALTDFTKRHRAIRDLNRLIELDPSNNLLYQAEIRKWQEQEQKWKEEMAPRHQAEIRKWKEKRCQEEEKDARRIQRILEKRRNKEK